MKDILPIATGCVISRVNTECQSGLSPLNHWLWHNQVVSSPPGAFALVPSESAPVLGAKLGLRVQM